MLWMPSPAALASDRKIFYSWMTTCSGITGALWGWGVTSYWQAAQVTVCIAAASAFCCHYQ